jgi:hypothetical protein
MIGVLFPVLALGSRTNGQIITNAYRWVGENLYLTIMVLLSAIFLVLFVWGITKLITKRRSRIPEPVQIETEPVKKIETEVLEVKEVETEKSSNEKSSSEKNAGENNQLGKSIVKAAWILGISIIVCVLLIFINHQYCSSRYAPLEKLTYIDTWTGKCYYSDGRIIE